MSPEINLHHIPLLQHHLVASVGGVVRRTVVDTQPTRESHTTLDIVPLFQTLVAGQGTDRILNTLRNLRQGLTRLDVLLGILAHLTVHLGSLTVLLQEIIVHAVQIALFLVGCAVCVVALVFDGLALGVPVGEEIRHRNAGWGALDLGASLLLLGLALLLLLCGCIISESFC